MNLPNVGLKVHCQEPIAIKYKDKVFDKGFRADIIIENKVLLELKSQGKLDNSHRKQVLTYLRLSGYKLGFLLNFGRELMKKGIVRFVNGLEEEREQLPDNFFDN